MVKHISTIEELYPFTHKHGVMVCRIELYSKNLARLVNFKGCNSAHFTPFLIYVLKSWTRSPESSTFSPLFSNCYKTDTLSLELH